VRVLAVSFEDFSRGNPFLMVAATILLILARPIAASSVPVTLQEDSASYTLSNGIVTAQIAKGSGDLTSLKYNGMETLTDQSGHAGAYWSHDASGGISLLDRINIDPKSNKGERAEVSVKGVSGGKKMGHPAGSGASGDFPADVEIRWCLGRGDPGIYAYCILTHQPDYPAGSIGEARFCAKLASMYDWISVDAQRNKFYPRELRGEDKYVYTADQFENRAYGWSSTTKKVGWWIVNPTIEYLSGGPTKIEFLCHHDTTPVQAPCVLNYWRSSHYGGASVSVAKGESWTKVVGPFFLYCNSGGDQISLWKDARARAQTEAAKWPYDWVDSIDYPNAKQRSEVSGRFIVNDPAAANGKLPGKLTFGLTYPAYAAPTLSTGTGGSLREIDWQTDAKHYEFWALGTADGHFTIPAVRPGNYTLHAFADGVLGEFAKTDVTIPPGGKPIDLGSLPWTPVRHGQQLWQIGTPDRSAAEFVNGDKYFEMDTQLQYPKLFPNDVDFFIGKSDPAKDWYFEQVPHNESPTARISPFLGVIGNGRATPYTIHFDLPDAPHGVATLSLAICAASTRMVEVSVNGKSAGNLDQLRGGDSTVLRHNFRGIWYDRNLTFNAELMHAGDNTLTLTVPAGPINNGIIYDCVRLELDETQHFSSPGSQP
jgi:rhamnogalacturonan endolyase